MWAFRVLAAAGVVVAAIIALPLATEFWLKGQHFAASVEALYFTAFVALLAWTTFFPASFKRFLQIP